MYRLCVPVLPVVWKCGRGRMSDIKPTIFLECWRSPAWGICCAQRAFMTVRKFNRWYDYHEHFYGKLATVHTGTNDYEITREELLNMATKFVIGDVVTLQFDLNAGKVTQINGRPSTPDY